MNHFQTESIKSLCPYCGGKKSPGKTTFVSDSDDGVLVIRDVPAMVCDQCGEEWIDNQTAKKLEQISLTRRDKKIEVEILAY